MVDTIIINNIRTIYNHFYFYFLIAAWLEKQNHVLKHKRGKEHTSIVEAVNVRLVVVNEETERGLDAVERKQQLVGI
jgi:hypothetical protein